MVTNKVCVSFHILVSLRVTFRIIASDCENSQTPRAEKAAFRLASLHSSLFPLRKVSETHYLLKFEDRNSILMYYMTQIRPNVCCIPPVYVCVLVARFLKKHLLQFTCMDWKRGIEASQSYIVTRDELFRMIWTERAWGRTIVSRLWFICVVQWFSIFLDVQSPTAFAESFLIGKIQYDLFQIQTIGSLFYLCTKWSVRQHRCVQFQTPTKT